MKTARLTIWMGCGALIAGVFYLLSFVSSGPPVISGNWLQLLAPPSITNDTNANSGQLPPAIATLSLSNAGPRTLLFEVQELRWVAGNFETAPPAPGSRFPREPSRLLNGQPYAFGLAKRRAGFIRLRGGAATNLMIPTNASLPINTPCEIFGQLPWTEQRSTISRILDRFQASYNLTLPLVSQPANGMLTLPTQHGSEYVSFRLRHGLLQSARSEPTNSSSNRRSQR